MKRLAVGIAVLVLAGSLAACAPGGHAGSAEPDYADDEAMAIIADGLEKRFDIADEQEASGEPATHDTYAEAIQAEMDAVAPLKKRQFEDSNMQEEVLAYANLLDETMDVVDSYPVTSSAFLDAWQPLYDQRTAMLKGFVDQYGLAVDFKHEKTFDDMLRNANVVIERTEEEDAVNQLVSSMVFEKRDDGYGLFTYTATVQNTSGLNFDDASLVLGLYDANGVRLGETFAMCSSWQAGETVVFEATSQIDAANVTASMEYYHVAE